MLKAFAGGSVALTGVEAIANGVPAFKPPEAKNAANTMTAMAVLLAILFVGLTIVAVAYGIRPTVEGGPSVVALAAETVFGKGSGLFVAFAASTALILFLAANTSFNAFRASPRSWPRTATCHASLVSRRPARYLGHQRPRGDRVPSPVDLADTHA